MPRVAWLLLLGVLSACSPEDPDTLRLLVASSAIEPARQIAAQYQQQSGIPVLVIAASSGALVRQGKMGSAVMSCCWPALTGCSASNLILPSLPKRVGSPSEIDW